MTTSTEFNPTDTLQTIVPKVFETMLGFTASPAPKGNLRAAPDRVSGTIGIAGENVTGAIYVHLTESLAGQAVNALLGNPPEESVGDGDLNDAVGELTNMIGGGFKSALCDAGCACAMSTPSIIRGAYAVEAPQDLLAEVVHFSCRGQSLAVEIHIKLD